LKKKKNIKKIGREKGWDVSERQTLFVRNIPYGTTEEELTKVFKDYGDVIYFKLTKDKTTGEPKGNGFVKFSTPESAQVCMEAAYLSKTLDLETAKKYENKKESDIIVNGKNLLIDWAVVPGKISEVYNSSTKKEKKNDPRNLQLAYIGGINPNSDEFRGLSYPERQKILAYWKDKKLKLASPNFHVSNVRLSVRGLPKY